MIGVSGRAVQLRLALDADLSARLEARVGRLEAVRVAVGVVLGVAEGSSSPCEAGPALAAALAVLADAGVGGRLGYVVRRYRACPRAVDEDWDELVDELVFALSLFPPDGCTEGRPDGGNG